MSATTTDPATTPGAMEHTKRRELPDGTVIEFEQAPAGWLTRASEVRQKDWRAYYLTAPGEESRRRVPSVTTILDAICPKPGLPIWSEARGIEGAIEMVRDGRMDPHAPGLDPVSAVRKARMGADRARDDAADRGLNVHACLEHYMLTGSPPNPADHPVEHRGYLRALTRWLLKADPQRDDAMVEELVASRTRGYAGRIDLRARLADGLLYAIDAKTQERGGIYLAAHAQIGLYEDAAVECGDEPADRRLVVVFAANGEFREMPADHPREFLDAALAWMRYARPIDSECERHNRIEREARKAVAS